MCLASNGTQKYNMKTGELYIYIILLALGLHLLHFIHNINIDYALHFRESAIWISCIFYFTFRWVCGANDAGGHIWQRNGTRIDSIFAQNIVVLDIQLNLFPYELCKTWEYVAYGFLFRFKFMIRFDVAHASVKFLVVIQKPKIESFRCSECCFISTERWAKKCWPIVGAPTSSLFIREKNKSQGESTSISNSISPRPK